LDYSYEFIIKLPTTTAIIKNLIFLPEDKDNKLTIMYFKRKLRRQFSAFFRKRHFFIYLVPAVLLYEIASLKILQLDTLKIKVTENFLRTIVGSLRSIGIGVTYNIHKKFSNSYEYGVKA